MRVKAGIWVAAYVRRLNAIPVATAVVRRGDGDAGAIFIKINTLDGCAQVLRPAASGVAGTESLRYWSMAYPAERRPESVADAYLTRQAEFDPDIWVVEVEDRQGRHFLNEYLVTE